MVLLFPGPVTRDPGLKPHLLVGTYVMLEALHIWSLAGQHPVPPDIRGTQLSTDLHTGLQG